MIIIIIIIVSIFKAGREFTPPSSPVDPAPLWSVLWKPSIPGWSHAQKQPFLHPLGFGGKQSPLKPLFPGSLLSLPLPNAASGFSPLSSAACRSPAALPGIRPYLLVISSAAKFSPAEGFSLGNLLVKSKSVPRVISPAIIPLHPALPRL